MDSKEKQLREEINDLHKAMKAISAKADSQKRDLSQKESEQHENLYNQIQAKKNAIAQHQREIELEGELTSTATAMMPVIDSTSNGSGLPKESGAKLLGPGERFFNARVTNDETDRLPAGGFLRSIMIGPKTQTERMAVQNSVTSSGYTLPTGVSQQIIDQLREDNPVITAGARSIMLPQESETSFITISDYPASVWHQELAVESTDAPTFGAVSMKAKTLLSLFAVPRELEMDSANIDEAIRLSFVGSLNDAVIAATFGTTADHTPTGLGTRVTQVEEYANAGDPDWVTMVKAQRKLYDNHVPKDKTSTIHSPGNWEVLNSQVATNGHFVDPPRGIADIPQYAAAGVPSGESYTGDFSNIVYGFRMNLSIERHPSLLAKQFGALWLAALRMDIGVFRPSALVRIQENDGE